MASTVPFTRPASRSPGRRLPQVPPPQPTSGDAAELVRIAGCLHPADCTLLIRLIGRVAELERTRGEAAALDMLETALARVHGAMGRA